MKTKLFLALMVSVAPRLVLADTLNPTVAPPTLFAYCQSSTTEFDFFGFERSDSFVKTSSSEGDLQIPATTTLESDSYRANFLMEGKEATIRFSKSESPSYGTLSRVGMEDETIQCNLFGPQAAVKEFRPGRGQGLATISSTMDKRMAIQKAKQEAEFNAGLHAKELCEGGRISMQSKYSYDINIIGNEVIVTATAQYACNPG